MLWIENLKKRWNVNSSWNVILILIVFALTGSSVMLLRRWLKESYEWAREPWFTYSYYWFILPFYNLVLLVYGFIFGQFRFFWNFEKRFFLRLFRMFNK